MEQENTFLDFCFKTNGKNSKQSFPKQGTETMMRKDYGASDKDRKRGLKLHILNRFDRRLKRLNLELNFKQFFDNKLITNHKYS